MMDLIQMARDLGKAIQADERYKNLQAAKENNDMDNVLQEQIGAFNLKRVAINQEVTKKEKDQEKLEQLDQEIKELYHEIMTNPNMIAYNEAKNEADQLMSFINQILVGSINGEDPDAIQQQSGCSGSCGSCSGCH